ncbi:MAG: DUF4870 domain-containing protein [Xanthomonadales bacterium]|jgi:uncharacterized Tic20 family protein|nr:DUF4870 domain-containing protein [Xanthomonadales bacterium]
MNETNKPGGDPTPPDSNEGKGPEPGQSVDRQRETNQWAMFIHFSMLAGWVIPLAGIVVPILIWQLKKDELPGIEPHAHVVMNWIVTSLVYAVICYILLLIVIGVLGFLILGVLTVAYAIIGGIKANDGELWEYPGTLIKVFK